MPNTITVYLGALGAIGAIELEVPGLNDLFPINANVAPNARGRRVEPGEYILDSIAYTPKTTEIQTAYGEAIIRFNGENQNKMAIFGGELAPDGSLLPTEGASIRVNNDVLGRIIDYINESGSETPLIVTDDGPGLINSIRINKWYGHPANTEQIGLIRPKRFKGKPVEQTFYTDSGLDDSDINDWVMWNLLYSMGDEAATETDFFQTYDEGWTGFEGGDTWEEIPEPGDVAPDSSEQSDEEPYIADPFADTERQNLTFENQSESPDDMEIEPEDTAGSAGADDAPDNNY
jgi:hypothetical protein